jgi:hypothetical protein
MAFALSEIFRQIVLTAANAALFVLSSCVTEDMLCQARLRRYEPARLLNVFEMEQDLGEELRLA